MNLAAVMNIDDLIPAWRALEARAPVRLRTITSERHYRSMVGLMNDLLDEVGERETHPLQGLLDIVTMLVEDYEKRNEASPEGGPVAVLRLLMEQHQLRQTDLAELFGSQSNVSEILAGKRSINARQAKALAERFGTSAAAFI